MTAGTTSITSRVVNLGRCHSGLLHRSTSETIKNGNIYAHPDVLQRMAIATPRAFHHLNNDTLLLQALSKTIQADGSIEPGMIRARGLWPELYEGRKGWTTFGIRFFNPPAEETPKFNEAKDLLQSTDTGVHRLLYMAMHGVRSFGIEDVPNEIYKAMLGRLFSLFNDPKHEKLRILTISRGHKFDKIERDENGEQRVELSYHQLQNEPLRSYPNLKERSFTLKKIDGKWIPVYR